jgi:hypothetical protein
MVAERNDDAGDSEPPGRCLRLAPGLALESDGRPPAMLLALTDGKVRLNQHALAILQLCDGSRSREHVIRDAMRAAGRMRATEVAEFLDAARTRGWLVECEPT